MHPFILWFLIILSKPQNNKNIVAEWELSKYLEEVRIYHMINKYILKHMFTYQHHTPSNFLNIPFLYHILKLEVNNNCYIHNIKERSVYHRSLREKCVKRIQNY